MSAPNFLDDPRLAKLLGLMPGGRAGPPPGPPPPMDIPAAEAEMAKWQARGGTIDPASDLASSGTPMPGGLYGGQFSDPEMAAFQDAQGKLEREKRLRAMAPILAAMRARTQQRPDATRRGP